MNFTLVASLLLMAAGLLGLSNSRLIPQLARIRTDTYRSLGGRRRI
jgi:hypothetical protein